MTLDNTSTVTYFEYYPHYRGTLISSFEMTGEEFKALKNIDSKDYHSVDAFVERAESRAGKHVYALCELCELFNFDIAVIQKALEEDGVWADSWEEGSFALSVKGVKAAKAACALVECELWEE